MLQPKFQIAVAGRVYTSTPHSCRHRSMSSQVVRERRSARNLTSCHCQHPRVVGSRPTAPERSKYSGRRMLDHSVETRTPRRQFHLAGSLQTQPEGHQGVASTLRKRSPRASTLPSTPTSPTWVARSRRRSSIRNVSAASPLSFFFPSLSAECWQFHSLLSQSQCGKPAIKINKIQ